MVSIGATKVTPNDNILLADPTKRNCYFDHENSLKAHKKYSQVITWLMWSLKCLLCISPFLFVFFVTCQVGCLLECSIEYALTILSDNHTCIPWYYPPVDPTVRICDPFEVKEFNKAIGNMPDDECDVSSVVCHIYLIYLQI
jgi:hypothetical protein